MAGKAKILVAVDGSDSSMRALQHAASMAPLWNASLVVLNVQAGIPPSRFVSRAMILEHQQRQADLALKRARAFIRRRRLDATVQARIGDAASTIAGLSKQRRCRQIFIGSRGLGRIKGMLLGSVVAKVIYLAPCPVTVVK